MFSANLKQNSQNNNSLNFYQVQKLRKRLRKTKAAKKQNFDNATDFRMLNGSFFLFRKKKKHLNEK